MKSMFGIHWMEIGRCECDKQDNKQDNKQDGGKNFKMTLPEKPNSKNQRYVKVQDGDVLHLTKAMFWTKLIVYRYRYLKEWVILYCEKIVEAFSLYRKNYEACCQSNDRLLEKLPWEEWESALIERAKIVSAAYRENQRLIQSYLLPMTKDSSMLSDEDFDCLFDRTKDMYLNDYEDPFILQMLLSILIPHYETIGDDTRLVMLYAWMAFARIEISRTGSKDKGKSSVAYYDKVIAYAERIGELQTDEARAYIYVAFVNLIFVEPTVGNITFAKAKEYYERFVQLRRNPWFCRYDESYPRIAALTQRIINDYAPGGVIMPLMDKLDVIEPGAPKYRISDEEFNAMVAQAGSVYRVEHMIVFNRYCQMAEEGKRSWTDTFDALEEYCSTVSEMEKEESVVSDVICFRTTAQLSLMYFLDKSDYPAEVKQEKARKIMSGVVEFFSTYPYGANSYTLMEALQAFSFDRMVMRYLGTAENRLRFLFRLVVARQPITYIHCTMVSQMVNLILHEVLAQHPEWLIGTQGTRSVEEVLQKQKQIARFARYAALIHDIGKNSMTDIVGTEYRAITNEEFAILKTHPEIGAEYLQRVPDLKDFADIVLGHHQFYDGQGGYPDVSVFDHRQSPVRFLLELVTLCDCLDAATDSLGRNYRTAKNFDTVMEEFRAGSGTHYNPDLVRMIDEDASLKEQLRLLTDSKRKRIYYKIYGQFYVQN